MPKGQTGKDLFYPWEVTKIHQRRSQVRVSGGTLVTSYPKQSIWTQGHISGLAIPCTVNNLLMSHLTNSTESHLHPRASFHLFIFPSLAKTVLILGLSHLGPLPSSSPSFYQLRVLFTTSFLDTPIHTPMIMLATPRWGNFTHLSSNDLPLHLGHSPSATAAPALNEPFGQPNVITYPFSHTYWNFPLAFCNPFLRGSQEVYTSPIYRSSWAFFILLTLDAISSPWIHSCEFVLPAHSQLDVNLIIPSSTGENDTSAGNISTIHWLFPTSVNPHTAFLYLSPNYLVFKRASFNTNRLGYSLFHHLLFRLQKSTFPISHIDRPHPVFRVPIIK